MYRDSDIICGKNQVWLYCSRLPLPISYIALHCWFVLADQENKISRWEIWQKPGRCKNSWGHLHQNLFSAKEGIKLLPVISLWKWSPRLLYYFDNSSASTLINTIRSTPECYPYRYVYKAFPGPNSNTFVKWVLNHLSDKNIELPISAIGRNWIKYPNRD